MKKNRLILIVDDNPSNIDLIVELLSDYNKIVALSGTKALELAKSQKPDLILLDIVMPDISGYEVCKTLKSNNSTKDIPILFITSKDKIDDEVMGFELGAFDYISKPISPPIVKARVKNILNYIESKEKIKDNLEQLKKSQNQLILNEKLVSLGNLVASIAHEINSPLGALISSNEILKSHFQNNIIDYFKYVENLDTASLNYLKFIVLNIFKNENDLSFKEKRIIKNNLTEKLEKLNLSIDFYEIVDILVEANITDIDSDLISILKNNDFEKISNLLSDIVSQINSLKIIKTSSNQIKNIVDALRNYSRYNNPSSESKINVDITNSIETVLTIFSSKIKRDVKINRNYLFKDKINCYPNQLIQVWTNLIHNSLQAMNYKGILDISTYKENEFVIITIKDNGNGIPDEIQDRIFEPFFTTKSIGEGTGLGLDIVKNIVLKHNGIINFESTPNVGTTFFVKLPVK